MSGKVRRFREAQGISHIDLCRKAGVSRPTLYMAEADDDRTRIETLIKIARALGVTLEELAPERAAEHKAALAGVS